MSATENGLEPWGRGRLEETLEYRSYLCLANMLLCLGGDGLGSDGDYDDSGYYKAHITELFGADIDTVFSSQHVHNVFGDKRWAFTDPANNCSGDDLEARLFHDRDYDLYYLVHRPTQDPVDVINNVLTGAGAGVPDKFQQAAQLIELVRPEFRDKIVLSGFSLGGGLAAYAALRASWPVRTVAFDPLGLNRKMMGERGVGFFGQFKTLSDQFRSMDEFVDWFYIANSWVAGINVERHLSSVGRVTELPQDPVRAANNQDSHDFRHVRSGLHRLWEDGGWRDTGMPLPEISGPTGGPSPSTIWEALEAAAEPVTVEYSPASETESTTYRTVPVNAAAQQAITDILRTVDPKGPTLFRVVLAEGGQLAPAVGGGLRGFATGAGGKITAHAVLKPVGAGGAVVMGWPVLAVAATVMVMDRLAQREQRAHQRKVEAILGRQEERYYLDRIKDRRSADVQLTRAISLILDGDNPSLEQGLKSADDVFHRSEVWLEKYDGVVARMVGQGLKVDYNQLEGALGGNLPDFFRELNLAHAAIAIRRKALLAEAAAKALADPSNPYTSFRRFLQSQDDRLRRADRIAVGLSDSLSAIQIRGGWPDSPKKVQGQEHYVQSMASLPAVDTDTTVQFLRNAAGEILQVLPA